MSEQPSPRELLMPPISPVQAEARLERWHVSEGQRVARGDVLAEVATASSTIEIEAKDEGRIARILVPAGTPGVKANTPIALLLTELEEMVPHGGGGGSMLPPASEPEPEAHATAAADPRMAPLPGLVQTYREALRDALAEEMRRDGDVFIIGTDVAQNRGAQKVTQGLIDEFGAERVVTAPPVEDALLGLAVGAALMGLRPVVEVTSWPKALEAIGSALTRAAELPYLTNCELEVPLVLRGPDGWASGLAGQEARSAAALLAGLPGLKVVAPATPGAAKALLKAAIRDPGVVAVLEHEMLYAAKGEVASSDHVADLGCAQVVRRGGDATLATFGLGTLDALEAAETLAGEGISVEVLDLVSLRPLDLGAIIRSVEATGRLVTIESNWPEAGIGAEIVAAVSEKAFGVLMAAPRRIAAAPVPMPYAETLAAAALPRAGRIAAAVRDMLSNQANPVGT